LGNLIVSEYATFCQINTFFVNMLFCRYRHNDFAVLMKLLFRSQFGVPGLSQTAREAAPRDFVSFIIMGNLRLSVALASQLTLHCCSSSDGFALRVSCLNICSVVSTVFLKHRKVVLNKSILWLPGFR